MLRTLWTPRWLAGTALAAAFAVGCVLLGGWQWERHEQKVAWRDQVEAHYAGPPVPLVQAAGSGEEWSRVQVSGRYAAADRLLVRNRPHRGVYGYVVLVPLRTADGDVLVSRGWVPNAADAATPPEVPPEPSEEVTVTGWWRPGERSLGRSLPAGQLASINVPEAESQLGRDLVDGYLVLEHERLPDGSAPDRPEPAEPPDTSLGPHLAYAVQWWLTAPVGFVLIGVFARREHRERLGLDQEPRRRAGKPAKRRIWDEEDE